MTRVEVQRALDEINEKIEALQARLNPPPLDPGERSALQNALVQAENARDTLVETLNNLPPD
jgi:hypothetical protein